MTQHVANTVSTITLEVEAFGSLALIDASDGVWIVVPTKWWDIATWAWWLLTPRDRRAVVSLKTRIGLVRQMRAVRMAKAFIHVRGAL